MHEHMYISFFLGLLSLLRFYTHIYIYIYLFIYLFKNTHVYIQTYYRNVLYGSSKILLNLMETAATISRLACGGRGDSATKTAGSDRGDAMRLKRRQDW